MKKLTCQTTHFLFSSDGMRLPKKKVPHIVIAGRSNVGKSSLLSSLFGKKNFARISGKPGKTRLINFFEVDQFFLFVDLPGFGFAKASKEEKDRWAGMIEKYIETFQNELLFVHLIDSRHPLQPQDFLFLEFAKAFPSLIVFTKIDKLLPSKRKTLLQKQINSVQQEMEKEISWIEFSTKIPPCRKHLIERLNECIQSTFS